MFKFIKSMGYILIFDGKKWVKAVWLVLLVRLLTLITFVFPRIVCTTAPYFGQEEKNSGQVLLTVAMTLTALSEDQFTYVVRMINTEF